MINQVLNIMDKVTGKCNNDEILEDVLIEDRRRKRFRRYEDMGLLINWGSQ